MVASNTSPRLCTSESKQHSLAQHSLANEDGVFSVSSSRPRLSDRFSEVDLLSRFVPSSAYSFSTLSVSATSGGAKSGVLRERGRSVFSRLSVRGRSVSQRGGVPTANPLSHRILSRGDLGG